MMKRVADAGQVSPSTLNANFGWSSGLRSESYADKEPVERCQWPQRGCIFGFMGT